MTKIAELTDKGAVVAWSPLPDYADVLALGSKVRFFGSVDGGGGVVGRGFGDARDASL